MFIKKFKVILVRLDVTTLRNAYLTPPPSPSMRYLIVERPLGFVGPMVCRTIGVSDQWCVGPMVCRTNGVSDQWSVTNFETRSIISILEFIYI